MRSPVLNQLPPPPTGKVGWPWTEQSPQLPDRMGNGNAWPRISIVTASFNRADFIEETIRGVLLQGYPNLEYLIADGGSTDGTVAIIERYRPFLTWYISEKDTGENHALNKALPHCTGEIITFNSSDDVYQANTFHDVAQRFLATPKTGAIIGAFRKMDGASHPTTPPIPAVLPKPAPLDLTIVPPDAWRLHQQATFYTRHALDFVGRYIRQDLKYTWDRELLYRVCRPHTVTLSERTYALYRVHSGSLTTGSFLAQYNVNMEFAGLHFPWQGDGLDADRKNIGLKFISKAYLNRAKARTDRLDAVYWWLKSSACETALLLRKPHWLALAKILKP